MSDQLMLFAEVSPAKIYRSQEKVRALMASAAAYGAKSPVLLANYDRATSSWKTSQRCLVEGWAEFSETWPRSGMTRNGIAYQLPTLAHLTDETGCGLLPTPRRSGQSRSWKAYVREFSRGNLEEVLGEAGYSGWITRQFVEWMMGFPLDWTLIMPSEMPSSRKSSPK